MSERKSGTRQGAPGERPVGDGPKGGAAGRSRTPWSAEAIAVIGTGVALLVAMIGGFVSLNSRLDELTRHRENRLASVQTHVEDRIEALRQTVDGNLGDQSARMTAIEVRLAELQVLVQTGSED